MRSGFKNLLVVVKHTPYEQYLGLKQQGKAPLALRWGRLKNRYMLHRECVTAVQAILDNYDLRYKCVGREELCRQHLKGVDLVISVGGDGTVLSAGHFMLDQRAPLLGINSDPIQLKEEGAENKTDTRRSHGALCMCTALDAAEMLPRVLSRELLPKRRARIQTVVSSTFTETRLPPALNDILLAHPSPAAVSRFRLGFVDDGGGTNTIPADGGEAEKFSFNVWSSGLWISTATGSSAAMQAAGGVIQEKSSRELQYMVREHLIEKGQEHLANEAHGLIPEGSTVHVRWNSLVGFIYVDGEHSPHPLKLGDEVDISATAPPIWLYCREGSGSNISEHFEKGSDDYKSLIRMGFREAEFC